MEYVLSTGVLNDDYVKFNRASGRFEVVFYTYANEWSNHEHIEAFNTLEAALAFYDGRYHARLEAQAEYESEREGEPVSVSDIIDSAYVFFEGVGEE